MTYTADGTARLMLLAAQRLDENPDTGRRAAELALPATHAADVHVASSGISDPTPDAALSEVPAIATYSARWRAATTALVGWVGSPLPSALRAAERRVAAGDEPWRNPYLLRQIGHHCDEVIRLIDLCRPMDLEQARKALDDEQRIAIESGYCLVCEAPLEIGKGRGGKCDADRKLQQRWTDSGRVDASDEAAFKAAVVADIVRGLLRRPESPHSPVGRQWVPEEAV